MPPRPDLPLPPIDPAPLKDIARGLRFVAEQGGKTLRKALPLAPLPEPAARLADEVLASALRVGHKAGRGVSALAHALLDPASVPPALDGPQDAEAAPRFAGVLHDSLRSALIRLGAEGCLISEAAAERAWRQAMHPGQQAPETAAALFLALNQAPVLCDALWPDPAPFTTAEAGRLALFAVLLALLADPANLPGLLPATLDIALALRADLAAADSPAAVAALFQEFRDHV